jgi:EAL domain-containing protein (putative c-di-GMP-specific phosphodiesterase class I)
MLSVEGLIRWEHPNEGMLSPGEFLPIAEESDLIVDIGEWVMRETCRQFAEWQRQLGSAAPMEVGINLSRRQFAQPDLPQLIQSVLLDTGVEPKRVRLEITEEALAGDTAGAIKAMKAVKALGVQVAIDDFGSSSSSIAALQKYPIDMLKLDRRFLADVEHSQDAASLVHGLAVMVKNLGIDLVAESIETPGQMLALQELGCDYGQGSFFSEPLLASEMHALLSRNGTLNFNTQGAFAFANRWEDRLPLLDEEGLKASDTGREVGSLES